MDNIVGHIFGVFRNVTDKIPDCFPPGLRARMQRGYSHVPPEQAGATGADNPFNGYQASARNTTPCTNPLRNGHGVGRTATTHGIKKDALKDGNTASPLANSFHSLQQFFLTKMPFRSTKQTDIQKPAVSSDVIFIQRHLF